MGSRVEQSRGKGISCEKHWVNRPRVSRGNSNGFYHTVPAWSSDFLALPINKTSHWIRVMRRVSRACICAFQEHELKTSNAYFRTFKTCLLRSLTEKPRGVENFVRTLELVIVQIQPTDRRCGSAPEIGGLQLFPNRTVRMTFLGRQMPSEKVPGLWG